jgi:transposase
MQMCTAASALKDELETYKERYLQLEIKNQELEKSIIDSENKYNELKEQYSLLVYKRFGRSAEKLLADEKQPLLFTEEAEPLEADAEEAEAEDVIEVKPHSRKKCGRKKLDPNLERKEVVIDIPESEKNCACGADLTKIGEESNEKLQIIPPQIFVEKTIRPKYACRSCEGTEDEDKPTVRIAPVEPSIIPRSIATPSLLSYILIQKYEDHLPFFRQEKQFQRIGVIISRQDMANWQQQVFSKLKPLFELLAETLKSGPVIQMDETRVQVMGEDGRSDTDKSWMWLARGGLSGKTVVMYEYRQTRAAYNAKALLEGFSGFLQTDGYQAYDSAVKDMPGITQVGCFAHARRKFFDASKAAKKPQSAEEGIKHIRKLYDLETVLRKEEPDENEFLRKRKEQAEPILAAFRAWLEKRASEVLPSASLGQAVAYTLKQWEKLVMYLESPHLTPDNNACENAIRPFVLGRKNWLFNKSPEGARSSCGIYSLIQTAKQNGITPLHYLTEIIEKAPFASSSDDWEKLLPWNIFID